MFSNLLIINFKYLLKHMDDNCYIVLFLHFFGIFKVIIKKHSK